ncbi:ATP-binding protein [Streptomyces murinus]|uniref:ATP-binding protein n=1 Tax=Streptomyces murinus TaxID=33900 RepID=UPI003F48357A
MEANHLVLSVPAVPASVTAARHRAAAAMKHWDAALDTELVHVAALVISELVTNAAQHVGAEQVSVAAQLTEDILRIEVCDASPALPRSGLPDVLCEGGRGLFIVAALADRFGTEPTPTGKRCWAEIAILTGSEQEIPVFLPLQRS